MADEDQLRILTDELLALCMPGPRYGADRMAWTEDVCKAAGRIARLGQARGWDILAAAQDRPAGLSLADASPPDANQRTAVKDRLCQLIECAAILHMNLAEPDFPRAAVQAELGRMDRHLAAAAVFVSDPSARDSAAAVRRVLEARRHEEDNPDGT